MSRGFPAATILFSNKSRDLQARSTELEGVKFHVYLTNCCVISGMRAAGMDVEGATKYVYLERKGHLIANILNSVES